MPDDTRDRVMRLESELLHMEKKLDQVSTQVKEMHEILIGARGAKWAIMLIVAIAGFFAGKLGAISSLFGVK
jgi:hypothetical protein